MERLRATGSAHAGMLEWLWQRVTSIYIAGFVVYVVVYLSLAPIRDHASWQAWFAIGYVRLAWAIFILSILVHAWIGMRSIYLDYLHPLWLRFSVSLFTGLGLLALGLWAARILLA
ncbi:succinate dehydrogenase [Sulfuricaulis limicola]|uniref:Succinate dehydrogenase hydrophobic membrane anchor subunit n=1 Tax=Sulfuricaulis limicola TaxID=1620215 RepID=A0A1B4XGA9_9GAMM|nr:succinate dehydrogenase, hydrophobic membrane anchor protein [Sulfuricaulis limicola]BAV33844.1 succinate dehydrogenase [Sulfuricaulis limicola]